MFSLIQKADRKIVLDLLTLYSNIKRSIVLHEDFSMNMRRPAELLMGRFDGFKVLIMVNLFSLRLNITTKVYSVSPVLLYCCYR